MKPPPQPPPLPPLIDTFWPHSFCTFIKYNSYALYYSLSQRRKFFFFVSFWIFWNVISRLIFETQNLYFLAITGFTIVFLTLITGILNFLLVTEIDQWPFMQLTFLCSGLSLKLTHYQKNHEHFHNWIHIRWLCCWIHISTS
jgi:hypothetical protein